MEYYANGGGGSWHANRRTSGQLSFEGKGRYGSFRLRFERVGVQAKIVRSLHVPYLSASEVVIHYEAALYQVYVHLIHLPLSASSEIVKHCVGYESAVMFFVMPRPVRAEALSDAFV